MPTRKAWDNAEYEGKALRKVFTRLQRRFMLEDDNEFAEEDRLLKIAHMMALVAKTKQDLAKYEYQDKRIKQLEDYIESKQLQRYVQIEGELPSVIR